MVKYYELVYNDGGIESLDEHRKDIIHIIQLHLEEIFSLLKKDEVLQEHMGMEISIIPDFGEEEE